MKTWDDWSDEELSLEITRIIRCTNGLNLTDGGKIFTKFDINGYHVKRVIDYCNSWADMGQIIQSSNIMVGSYNWIGFACGNFRDGVDEQIWDYEFYHENRLRAAAIVFLMMNGVNP